MLPLISLSKMKHKANITILITVFMTYLRHVAVSLDFFLQPHASNQEVTINGRGDGSAMTLERYHKANTRGQ